MQLQKDFRGKWDGEIRKFIKSGLKYSKDCLQVQKVVIEFQLAMLSHRKE